MSKIKGVYKSADIIEVITSHPLDPRIKWDSWASLTTQQDWPTNSNGEPYLYAGLIVSVNEGNSSSPDWEMYILNDSSKWDIPFGEEGSGWKKIVTGDNSLFWEDETSDSD